MHAALTALVLLAWGGPAFATGTVSAGVQARPGHAPMQSSLTPAAAPRPAARAEAGRLVDLNRASVKQLKTLPGIGDAQAQKIIQGRPYTSKTDLVAKDVLPLGVYLSLKNRVIAWQRVPPPVKR